MIRTKVLDPIYDGGPERLVVEFVPPGAPLPAVFVVLDRGDEYRLALCIAEVAKQRLFDVHVFVHALALELRR